MPASRPSTKMARSPQYTNLGSEMTLPAGCGAGFNVAASGGYDFLRIGRRAHGLAAELPHSPQRQPAWSSATPGPTRSRSRCRASPATTTSSSSCPPSPGPRPVITPPTGSTAAFQLMNTSVTLQSLTVVSTNPVAYGILGLLGLCEPVEHKRPGRRGPTSGPRASRSPAYSAHRVFQRHGQDRLPASWLTNGRGGQRGELQYGCRQWKPGRSRSISPALHPTRSALIFANGAGGGAEVVELLEL